MICDAYATRQTAASPSAVWALLADLDAYTAWGIWDDVSLQAGDAHTQAGSVRKMRSGIFVVRERILQAVPEELLEYELLSGMPVRKYIAYTAIERTITGCRISWGARFSPLIPGTGTLLKRQFSKLFEDLLRRLATAAEVV